MIGVSSEFAPSALLHYEEVPQDVQRLLKTSRDDREAFDWGKAYARALDVYEIYEEENTHVCLALTQIHMADCYSDVGEIGKAIDLCEKASEIFQRQPVRAQQHNEAVAAYALGILHTLLPFRDDVQVLHWYREALTLFKEAKRFWAKRNDQSHFNICKNVSSHIEKQIVDIHASSQAGSDTLDILHLGSTKTPFTINQGYVLDDSRVEINETIYYLHSGTLPSRDVDNAHYCFALPVHEWQQAFPAAQDSDYVVVRLHWWLNEERAAKLDNAWISGAVWSPDDGWDVGDFTVSPEGKIWFHSCMMKPQIMGGKDTQGADRKGKDSTWARKGHIIGLLKPDTASSSRYSAPSLRPSSPPSSELPVVPLPWEHEEIEIDGIPRDKGDKAQDGPVSQVKPSSPTQIKVLDPVWLFSDDLDVLNHLLQSSGKIEISKDTVLLEEYTQLKKPPASQLDLSVPEIEMSITIRPRQVDVRWPHEWDPPTPEKDVVSRVQKFATSRRHPLYFLARKGWQLVTMSIAFVLLLPMTLSHLLSDGSNDILNAVGILGILIGGILGSLAFVGGYIPSRSRVTLWKSTREKFSQRVQKIAGAMAGIGVVLSLGAFIGSRQHADGWEWLTMLGFLLAVSAVVWLFGFSMQRVEH